MSTSNTTLEMIPLNICGNAECMESCNTCRHSKPHIPVFVRYDNEGRPVFDCELLCGNGNDVENFCGCTELGLNRLQTQEAS